jgi:hypothetical protein
MKFLMLHVSTETKIRNHNVLGFLPEETFPGEGFQFVFRNVYKFSAKGNADFGISHTLKMNDILYGDSIQQRV